MTTIRTLWLILGYAGLGLALVVGNRMSVVAPGLPKQDHSKRESVKIGKLDELSNELSPAQAAIAAGDTPSLHLRAHQYGGSRRDATMRDWLVYDGPPVIIDATGRSATGLNEVGEEEALFERLGPPSLGATLSREPALPFVFDDESASFFNGQRQRARKRPGGGGGGGGGGGFKHAKKVVGLPPLLYGGTEEETPPGSRRSDLDELFGQRAFENAGGLPFEPPDPSRKPQGGGIGLSPLIFDADKPPGKRNQAGGGRSAGGGSASQQSPPSSPASVPGGAAIASQFMLRSARGNRQYDVPQIECPSSEDGMERFACPTPDRMGRYRCIDDHVLCDGFIDCPTGEDEDRQACMFYKTTKAHLDVLADALLRWARGR